MSVRPPPPNSRTRFAARNSSPFTDLNSSDANAVVDEQQQTKPTRRVQSTVSRAREELENETLFDFSGGKHKKNMAARRQRGKQQRSKIRRGRGERMDEDDESSSSSSESEEESDGERPGGGSGGGSGSGSGSGSRKDVDGDETMEGGGDEQAEELAEETWAKHWDEGEQCNYYISSLTGESMWQAPGERGEQGWMEAVDPESGCTFLTHSTTGATEWKSADDYTPNPNGDNSPVWEELKDPVTGEHYYYSNANHESQWTPPEWLDYFLDDGDGLYYFNTVTHESQWERPRGFVLEARPEVDQQQQQQQPETSTPAAFTTGVPGLNFSGAAAGSASIPMETPRDLAEPTPRLIPVPGSGAPKRQRDAATTRASSASGDDDAAMDESEGADAAVSANVVDVQYSISKRPKHDRPSPGGHVATG